VEEQRKTNKNDKNYTALDKKTEKECNKAKKDWFIEQCKETEYF